MPQVGPLEILVIFVVALLVFGPKEIPKVARQAAKGWREVQRFQASLRRDIDDVLRDIDEEEEHDTPAPTLPPKQTELDAGPSAANRPSPPADPTP
ncbi:MAG: Sec-independent protein translocase subunit TatA/TatB [Acidimicrobiia bacterium]